MSETTGEKIKVKMWMVCKILLIVGLLYVSYLLGVLDSVIGGIVILGIVIGIAGADFYEYLRGVK